MPLHMLLDHTTGFPNLRRFMPDKKLKFYYPPGSRFTCSGEGILLGQVVVETVTSASRRAFPFSLSSHSCPSVDGPHGPSVDGHPETMKIARQ